MMAKKEKCLAKDRHSDNCRNHSIGDTRFCKLHQYMNEYTDTMLENLTLCQGCSKMYWFADADTKTCSKCRERGKTNREKSREEVVLCGKEGCSFKKSVENKYCGKHQICLFIDETKSNHKKMCREYIRGCRAQLELDDGYSKCEDCRAKEREKDHQMRSTFREINEKVVDKTPDISVKLCNTCGKEYDLSHFSGLKTEITKTCSACREQNRIQDAKRDKEHRNELARIAETKPERKAVKQQWNENNPDKVVKKSLDYQHRLIETLGMEGYLKQKNENRRIWKENNPEKYQEMVERQKRDKQQQYNHYVRGAAERNIRFELTYEEYCDLVIQPCYYCDVIQGIGFNGIDKKYPQDGYVLDNSVSCCKMCNYSKGTLSDDVFIKRAEHILTYQAIVNGRLFPETFANHISGSYKVYRTGAIERNLEFVMSEEEYNDIVAQPCYLCGKQNTETHRNGVDRVDNKVGYISDNIKPCCGECNYMKKNFDLDALLDKYKLIYEKHKNRNDVEEATDNSSKSQNNIIVRYIDKKYVEMYKEHNKQKKQKRLDELKEKFADEEYRKMRAQEIAQQRFDKKMKEYEPIILYP
jgi:hypothetical protein